MGRFDNIKVGFIGFGEVASTMASKLLDEGVEVLTATRGRSERTKKLARDLGVSECSDILEVSRRSDIVISAVTPSVAMKVAREVGNHVRGVYVDINNVAPSTVKKALDYIRNGRVVDAAIMGRISKDLGVKILASGVSAHDFAKLTDYGFNIEVRGDRVGDASALKMLRSSYTKGVSALLWETLLAAYRMGLDEDLLEILEETENEGFRERAISRVISSALHSKRRYEEMKDVESFLSENITPIMSKCTSKTFKRIFMELDDLRMVFESYTMIFDNIKSL
ncbi:NAD(P)-dependent oxidoreductase [Methanothermobacter tenebrarum]|uniref:NAD(P)-dependent oxidoreductase n=1 Tax=Methanothermobacter tenebrarum TaxID=680118 RepID=UPI001FEA9E8E|nr:NAD(P)-binding domain-containing protein [Methanothermobacter tenebrarum]